MKNLIEFFNQITPLSENTLRLMNEIFTYAELKKGDYFVRLKIVIPTSQTSILKRKF